jgi:hypothetical protein
MKTYTMPSPLVKDFGSYTNPSVLDWADSDDEDVPSSSREPEQAYC